jgi:hypothetical protein
MIWAVMFVFGLILLAYLEATEPEYPTYHDVSDEYFTEYEEYDELN